MHLTAHTDYALRILMFAAARHLEGAQKARFSVEDVAQAYGISRNHVMKIVQRLAGAGYLASFRGRGGGLALGCHPEEVRLGGLIRFLEQDMALVACFGTSEPCRIGGACGLQRALHGALDAFFTKLDETTLADLALRPRAMALLTLPAA
jgi:Rrf2 family transcriptional regulator, nitric oxide-sensitive transcriptional repressor